MSHKFPRGFKQECERLVIEVRHELGVNDASPIDMSALAEHLCIPMTPLGELLLEANVPVEHPHVVEAYNSVSAVTHFTRRRRRLIYNERHPHLRHRSNLAHELAHALLHHPPEGESGSSAQDKAHEAEAGWLGGVLMLPEFQALTVVRTGMTAEQAIEQFELSREMLVYRLRITGALKRYPLYLAAA